MVNDPGLDAEGRGAASSMDIMKEEGLTEGQTLNLLSLCNRENTSTASVNTLDGCAQRAVRGQ